MYLFGKIYSRRLHVFQIYTCLQKKEEQDDSKLTRNYPKNIR